MNENQIISAGVERYDSPELKVKLAQAMDILVDKSQLLPTTKVVIKPNLLTNKDPSKAVTTHPAVVQGVVDWLLAQGVTNITIAESGGGEYNESKLKALYSGCGMDTVMGATLNWDTTFAPVKSAYGKYEQRYNIITPIINADMVINIAKLKTHSMTTMTAGAKNLFGCVPGLQKPALHCKYPNKEDFSGMLVELAKTISPQVTIIDAIDCMEGDGPSGGKVRYLGYLFAATNPFALDYFATGVMGIAHNSVEMLNQAKAKGLINMGEMKITGDIPKNIPPFVLPRSRSLLFIPFVPSFMEKGISSLVTKLARTVPKINTPTCIGCGKCAQSCPVSTITMKNKKAEINLKKCISCFCCHEMCPVQAIDIKRKIG